MKTQKAKNQDLDKAPNPGIAAGFQPAPTTLNGNAPSDCHDRIECLAHQLWEQRGQPHGDALADWVEAEGQIINNGAAQ